MNILDLVESWAKEKGWWTFKVDGTYEDHPDGYLYIAQHNPHHRGYYYDIFTLWADAHWSIGVGEYPDNDSQKLEPADPGFFLNLEYLITKQNENWSLL